MSTAALRAPWIALPVALWLGCGGGAGPDAPAAPPPAVPSTAATDSTDAVDAPAAKVTKDEPFAVALATPTLELSPGQSGALRVSWSVLKDHYVYRDMSGVAAVEPPAGLEVGEASFPPGKVIHDPISESEREIFETGFAVSVPVQVAAGTPEGTHALTLQVKWQGCNKPENYCLFPAKKQLTAQVKVVAAQREARRGLLDLLVPSAHAAAGSGKRPKPPEVSFAGLPETADVQKMDEGNKPHPVRARLLTDRAELGAGGTFRLGVHLRPNTNWHTYWKSPGETGLPTEIEWRLPEGWAHTDFAFPVPERFDQAGIISYGYDGDILFHSDVTLPADVAPGEYEVGAKAVWLVCEVQCIRGEVELTSRVAVLPGKVEAQATPWAALFDHFAAQLPVEPTSVEDFAFEATLSTSAVQPEQPFKAAFKVTPLGGVKVGKVDATAAFPTFVPIAKLEGFVNEVVVRATDDGGVLAIVDAETFDEDPLPTDNSVGGLFMFQRPDGSWVRTELTLPVPWVGKDATPAKSASPWFAEEGAAAAATAGGSEGASGGAAATAATTAAAQGGVGFLLKMLFFAFLGGLILNVMPCVLPVLTMKLYSLVEQGNITAAKRQKAGVLYSAGVVLSFLALALTVVIAKGVFGFDAMWGFQFQYPAYVAVLATIVFAFGLSLFGVFEVPAFGASAAAGASNKDDAVGYLLTGVFATLLATPCSAPFLGTGMGFAFSLPSLGIIAFFGVAGLGLAFPFLLIAFVPALYRFLPKPGAWMETFKHIMGFSLIATTVWLVDVLAGQVGREGATGFLAFLTFVGIGCWIIGRWAGPIAEPKEKWLALLGAGLVVTGGGLWWLDLDFAEEPVAMAAPAEAGELEFHEEIPWQPFSDAALDKLAGSLVFVDFTADWCLTCKVNEKTVLNTRSVRDGMAELDVVPLKADWTRRDEAITRWLKRYGKAGVPFYLVVPGDRTRDPIPLPEVVTPEIVLDALREASG